MPYGFNTGGEPLRMVVRKRSSTYTLTRVDSTGTGNAGETTTTTSDHDEDLWLFDDRRSKVEELFGEEVQGDLGCVALDEADVQKHDRLTYDGAAYEVEDEPRSVPSEGSQIVMVSLTEREND